jgi:hypothetical protein
VHAVAGVAEHAARQKRPLRVDAIIGEAPDPHWGGAFAQVLASGSYMDEAAFFHRPSRTLILTDLIENFEPAKLSRPLRLAAWAAGSLDPHGSMPRYYRLTFLGRRRAALRAAVGTMIRWSPERIILAHGRWYADNATAELRRAFAWLGV